MIQRDRKQMRQKDRETNETKRQRNRGETKTQRNR